VGESVGEAGWQLGITCRDYVASEDGTAKPDRTTYDRICELYGRPDARSGSKGSNDHARVDRPHAAIL
jgi:hypothetical protein